MVESRADPKASGGVYHKLLVDQMGDYGQYVEYRLEVPEAGDYFITVNYLRNAGPFEYLGFAQLTVNAEGPRDVRYFRMDQDLNPFNAGHRYWDQSGLTKRFISVPLGKVSLTAGEHRFRFDPVWKDGYVSGDYDITIDAIQLSRALHPLPATEVNGDLPGLKFAHYDLTAAKKQGAGWYTRIPDYGEAKPTLTGVLFNVAMISNKSAFGYRFTGWIHVETEDIYTFTLGVKGQANLYIGGEHIIDCNGPHGFFKEEDQTLDHWYKYGRVPLSNGKHRFRLDFASFRGNESLKLFWERDGKTREEIPEAAFTYGGLAAGPE